MTPGVAGLLGGAAAAGYIPILRRQIRDGEIGIPFGTINPLRIRRNLHPRGFRVAAVAMTIAVVTLVLAGLALVLFGFHG